MNSIIMIRLLVVCLFCTPTTTETEPSVRLLKKLRVITSNQRTNFNQIYKAITRTKNNTKAIQDTLERINSSLNSTSDKMNHMLHLLDNSFFKFILQHFI